MKQPDVKTVHIEVTGTVQGVFFRDYTKLKADELHLFGWVRNCPDGTVEAIVSGKEADVMRMIDWFHRGSPLSRVQRVIINKRDAPAETNLFQIKYSHP